MRRGRPHLPFTSSIPPVVREHSCLKQKLKFQIALSWESTSIPRPSPRQRRSQTPFLILILIVILILLSSSPPTSSPTPSLLPPSTSSSAIPLTSTSVSSP